RDSPAQTPGSGGSRPVSVIAALMATQMAVASPVVDGALDEPAWAQAVRLAGFSQLEPVDGRPAVERTEVLAWYSPDAIHFGILAYDREPGSIRATNA